MEGNCIRSSIATIQSGVARADGTLFVTEEITRF